MEFNYKQFVGDRRRALTAFVLNDDMEPAKQYCKKYGVKMPKQGNIYKAALYKATQECTDISDDVKAIAAQKCIDLGFKPTMWES